MSPDPGTRHALLFWCWLVALVATGATGGLTVAATATSPQAWVQWLGLATLAPFVFVFAVGVAWLARVMTAR